MSILNRVILSTAAITFSAVSYAGAPQKLTELADWMTGSFNSKAQSESDKRYFHINLEMVRIWPERKDAVWLYIEQAVSTHMDKPYRQRVYKVTQSGDEQVVSAVYAFAEPGKVIGAWKKPQLLADMTPDQLKIRQGCAINLKISGPEWQGSTQEGACQSSLHGASYATSQVTISPSRLISWDRGFDTKGEQVWGAEAGPYIFDKVKNYPTQG